MEMYPVFISCKYDAEDPTPSRKTYSVFVPPELLSFAVALKDATIGDGRWEIEAVQIASPKGSLKKSTDHHCASLSEFIHEFGTVTFRPSA